jgi:hypothetical protein
VHPWTLKDDFLIHTTNPIKENMLYMNMGVDGIFTEFPHVSVATFNNALHLSNEKVNNKYT